jgi:hypothetical protein
MFGYCFHLHDVNQGPDHLGTGPSLVKHDCMSTILISWFACANGGSLHGRADLCFHLMSLPAQDQNAPHAQRFVAV